MPKGWKLTSSPYWTRSKLFVGVKLSKNCKISKDYGMYYRVTYIIDHVFTRITPFDFSLF